MIKVKKLDPRATFERATDGSAGYDLTCVGVDYKPDVGGLTVLFLNLGVEVEPPVGTYFDLVPRSSLYKQPVIVANSFGVIDNDYRGTWNLIVKPIVAPFYDVKDYTANVERFISWVVGQRVAQAILRPMSSLEVDFVDELSTTERGDGGFGSTG